ncbi:EsaB/YukD family protein [Dactylosporangium sp. NPDC000244]|uniref:EsaB/YukD family protein n=1 Tax=Dactylosporangium sp. NPDC000244 TaxID=3154365 RepID=UPI00331D00FF
MADDLSRVTVIGEGRRIDVAVPAATPIGEYVPRLARMCGQHHDPMLPPAWSLAVAGERPFPLSASLSELAVDDGQVLYLRDLAREPGEAPRVEDLDEIVELETRQSRRRLVWRGPGVLVFGLLATTVLAAWLSWHPAAAAPVAVWLTLLALLLVGLAWLLGQRGTAVARPLRLAVALTSVPCLAVAGETVAEHLGGPGARWAGLVAGGNLAGLIVLAAMADVVLAVVAIHLAVVGGTLAVLMWVGANRVQAAGFVVLAAFGIFGVVRRTAATMAAWASGSMRTRAAAADATVGLVHESGRLLTLLLVLPAGAMVLALPILAMSGGWWAVALAATASAGLLARAWLAGLPGEMLLFTGGGLTGVFFVLAAAAGMLSMSLGMSSAMYVVAAVALIGAGVAMTLYGPEDPTAPSTTRPPRRRTPAAVVSTVCSVLVAPLAMGVFGVLRDLVELGRGLF